MKIVPTWTLGDRLRKCRTMMKMTQARFSDLIEVPESRFAQWEAENNQPRDVVDVARRVEKATGISATWILGLDDGPDDGSRVTNRYPKSSKAILIPNRHESHLQAVA